jgi:hypothetical protein
MGGVHGGPPPVPTASHVPDRARENDDRQRRGTRGRGCDAPERSTSGADSLAPRRLAAPEEARMSAADGSANGGTRFEPGRTRECSLWLSAAGWSRPVDGGRRQAARAAHARATRRAGRDGRAGRPRVGAAGHAPTRRGARPAGTRRGFRRGRGDRRRGRGFGSARAGLGRAAASGCARRNRSCRSRGSRAVPRGRSRR